jgi:hypothetical protein
LRMSMGKSCQRQKSAHPTLRDTGRKVGIASVTRDKAPTKKCGPGQMRQLAGPLCA